MRRVGRAPTPTHLTSRAKMRIDLLNGPNLNLLGTREPALYGTETLAEIETALVSDARGRGVALHTFQSSHEGALVDRIHEASRERSRGIIINPAAYTHTSIAIRDAFLATGLSFVEVHLSNIFAREAFRHRSMLSDIALAVITGCGSEGYAYALDLLHKRITDVSA